jgi:hypothetical protein
MRGDLTNYEKIFGQTPFPPQSPSQGPFHPNAPPEQPSLTGLSVDCTVSIAATGGALVSADSIGRLGPSPSSQSHAPPGRFHSQAQQPPTAERAPPPSARPALQSTMMNFVTPLIDVLRDDRTRACRHAELHLQAEAEQAPEQLEVSSAPARPSPRRRSSGYCRPSAA